MQLSVEECIETAEIKVVLTADAVRIASMFPIPDGTALISTIDLEGQEKFPELTPRAYFVKQASLDDILSENCEYTRPPAGILMPHSPFEEVLRRCGLYPKGDDPYGLATWRELLADGGVAPNLGEMNSLWVEKIERAGIAAYCDRIDRDALDLLQLSSLYLLEDEQAYCQTRRLDENCSLRLLLENYPMIFGEIWCSPEITENDLSSAQFRKLLSTSGLSCERMNDDGFEDLPPLPEWLIDWLESRRYSASNGGAKGVFGALVMLSILGEASAPETEKDWQALVYFMRIFDTFFWLEGWPDLLPAVKWRNLLPVSGRLWSEFIAELKAAVPPDVKLSRTMPIFWDMICEESGIDRNYHFGGQPFTDEVASQFVDALGRLSLADRLATGEYKGRLYVL